MLASGSPRRREMLERLGVRIVVRPVEIDESVLPAERPLSYVERLAAAKAAQQCDDGELVIAADTCVVVDGTILGKPLDEADARRMLELLAGRTHEVLTGLALAHRADHDVAVEIDVARTEVDIKPLAPAEIDWYVGTGECFDKAGAYAIQGLGSMFVTANRGSYANVVGLPIASLYRLFERAGSSLLDWIGAPRPGLESVSDS